MQAEQGGNGSGRSRGYVSRTSKLEYHLSNGLLRRLFLLALMKLKSAWIILATAVVAIAAMWSASSRRPNKPAMQTDTVYNLSSHPATTTASGTVHRGQVVVPTGQERMSNAVRCLAFISNLAEKMPNERSTAKRAVMTYAGIIFFNDCLMSQISNGHVNSTTNYMRESYSNAVSQVFTNGAPIEINDAFSLSFDDRNNWQVTLDDQYKMIKKIPGMTESMKKLDAAFQDAGVTDAGQSDLKLLILSLCQTRTTAFEIYGPKSDAAIPDEYRAFSDSFDQIMAWRMTNMFGLDDASAQAIVKAVERLPVSK
ncbi:MAG TPA: hypothetical protein VFC07_03850, partial [Verrucomicrobiae bacterium]|nr:hypothetical protein [Verrucomicrobiae bacterium]